MITNTDTLVYNLNTHKYYITSDGFRNRFGNDLADLLGDNKVSGITEEEVFIKQVSDRVYRWLYGYIKKQSKKIIEKWIADNIEIYGTPFRDAIEEALYAQAEYMINFDGDMKAINEHDHNKLVSLEVKEELIQAGVAFAGNICATVSSDEYRNGY